MAGSPAPSVNTWVGYDAPGELWDAASESYADNGKAGLSRFEDGLRASHGGSQSHNTMLGHSYGTTVVGHAARDGGLNADDLVFVASPGAGVDPRTSCTSTASRRARRPSTCTRPSPSTT
ncbi:alpha/beta hydrolase [Amycolatopsis sp. FDAARGOS 1241]|uniref:alpha/beta hydrolase n=1 Tax=Amycolatopsis sp. FDAARGOS 1241 TaxID=2778070 RepID=UPI001EF1D815|nr:alpha/beta hydrolase [Amycolatopsis sp. FDAARGOS 1241]